MRLTLSPNNFRDIGIMVYRTSPEIAVRCLSMMEKTKPELEDLSLISQLFHFYCQHQNVDRKTYTPLRNPENVYLRLVFIAIIIKLYNPGLLIPNHSSMMKRGGLRKELAKTLHTHQSWISQKVKIIGFHLDHYDEFASDVSAAMWELKKKINNN